MRKVLIIVKHALLIGLLSDVVPQRMFQGILCVWVDPRSMLSLHIIFFIPHYYALGKKICYFIKDSFSFYWFVFCNINLLWRSSVLRKEKCASQKLFS
jgi:hypothetical protein